MSIQSQLNAQVAELDRAVKAVKGPKFSVNYAFERHKVVLYAASSDWKDREVIALGRGAKTIDEALANAPGVIAGLRTYEDECADLGIPAAAQS